jgi:hypothetical protein
MKVGPIDVLDAHVRRFNEAVRSGDFAEMVNGFTADAEMVSRVCRSGRSASVL